MAALIIVACVFVGMAIIVTLTEKFGKPLEPGEQQKYSKIIVTLVGVLLVVAALKHFLS